MLTTTDMLARLSNVSRGTLLFVSYAAGREPTARAIEEARPHTENPKRSRRHFVGELSSVWTARNGDTIMTVYVHNRDTGGEPGAYRSFNPALGELLALEVLS